MMEVINNNNTFGKKIKNIGKQLIVIILYLIVTIFLGYAFNKHMNSNNFFIANISSIFVELIILTLFIFIFRKKIIPDFYDFKKNGKEYLNKYYIYYIIGYAVMLISNIIINIFIDMPTNEELNRAYLFKMPIYSIISIIIIAPIIEEALTRSILKDTFKRNIIYYFISSFIFASLHMLSAESPLELFYLIPYGALGWSFAVIYKKSNNIWTNITFHCIHNLIAIILIFLGA